MERPFRAGDKVVWAGDLYTEEPPGGEPAVVRPGDVGEVWDVEPDGWLGWLSRVVLRRSGPVGMTVWFPETGGFGCLDTDVRHIDGEGQRHEHER